MPGKLASIALFFCFVNAESSADTLVTGKAESGNIGGIILKALNAARVVAINPAIKLLVPDALNTTSQLSKAGETGSTCILPLPFHGCGCHAKADYSVSLEEIKGLKGLHITNFTRAAFKKDLSVINVVAEIEDADAQMAPGIAEAGVTACGIHPKVSGSASTHAHLKYQLNAFGAGKFDPVNRCFQLSFTNVTVGLDQVQIYHTSLDIKLGPVPGMNIGLLVDLVNGMAPEIGHIIEHYVQRPISKAVTDAVSKAKICIKIPVVDVVKDRSNTDELLLV